MNSIILGSLITCAMFFGVSQGDAHPYVDHIYCDGSTPLINAIKQGQVPVINSLLNHRANVNYVDYHQKTPLIYAVQSGLIEIVTCLLAQGANVNYGDRLGRTVLMFAEESKHKEVITLIEDHIFNTKRGPQTKSARK